MKIPQACACGTTRDGHKAGCASVDVIDTEHGPRFVESSCGGNRGDGGPTLLEQAQARADAEKRAAYQAGAPAGAMTRTRASADGPHEPRVEYALELWNTVERDPAGAKQMAEKTIAYANELIARGDSHDRLDRALARQAEERRAAYQAGAPAGAMTRRGTGNGIGRA